MGTPRDFHLRAAEVNSATLRRKSAVPLAAGPRGQYGRLSDSAQPSLQFGLLVLVAGLTQQGVHVVLVGLHAGLVEGVHVQQVIGS